MMTAPVAGSGSWPSWIARVSKSISAMRSSEPAAPGPAQRRGRARPAARRRSHQTPFTRSTSRLAVEDGLDPPDDPVAAQDRQDVVAVLALRLRHVHLEPVVEAPERLGAVAVVDEPVERGEERRARSAPARRRRRGCASQPALARAGRPARGSAARRSALAPPASGTGSVSGYQRSARSQSRCRRRRPTTATSPRSASEHQHERHLRGCPTRRWSSRLAGRVILDLAREQRPAPLELAEDVAAEARRSPSGTRDRAARARCSAARPAHPRAQERQVLDRADERVDTRRASAPPRAAGRARPRS